jgi:hypothetical protein
MEYNTTHNTKHKTHVQTRNIFQYQWKIFYEHNIYSRTIYNTTHNTNTYKYKHTHTHTMSVCICVYLITLAGHGVIGSSGIRRQCSRSIYSYWLRLSQLSRQSWAAPPVRWILSTKNGVYVSSYFGNPDGVRYMGAIDGQCFVNC